MSPRRRWTIGLAMAGALVLLAVAWIVVGAVSAVGDLTASRDQLLVARTRVADSDVAGARTAIESAADHASKAADTLSTPMWDVLAAVPFVGATPASVQVVAVSLDQALSGLAPAVESLGTLDPASFLDGGGDVSLAAMADSADPLSAASDAVAQASSTLAAAPALTGEGGPVPGFVRSAATDLAAQLVSLGGTVANAAAACRIAPVLLGLDGPKRYFVGILNPNEARGTGGFLGTYAIVRADAGRLSVAEVGSNNDLTSFGQLPLDLGDDYFARYGDDPALIGNMNLSPHFPDAAKLWLESWRAKTGESLDGAFSADVVALGQLVTASGGTVSLPGGGTLTGDELTRFAISGIYERFPTIADAPARKAYQVAVTRQAVEQIAAATDRSALMSAVGRAMGEQRVLLWSADGATEKTLLATPAGGSIKVPEGHVVSVVTLNSSGSKLDAWLQRSVDYEVGRCPVDGRVESRVTVTLTSAIPKGTTVPPYMVSGASSGPTGPINTAMAQVHVPNGGEILEVLVDGESVGYSTFEEQGRTSVVLDLALPPRQAHSMTVVFSEPDSPGPGVVPEQPLANPQHTTITDRGC